MSRQLREREVLSVLLRRGAVLPCFRCKEPILYAEDAECEHLHEHKLGGEDGPLNRGFSHKGCHYSITFGNGATTAGSSIGRIAKAKRLVRTQKMAVNKPAIGEPKVIAHKRRMAKRVNPWPAKGSRKMQSRSSFGPAVRRT